jgi:UDP-hydrolysing UDP-N-acetyl-D-glucosamine 2-epimerase
LRTIGVVTVARSDYGLLRPVLRAIEADDALRLRLYVSGMHLAPAFGNTVEAIEADGFAIDERVETLAASDTPTGVATSMGLGAVAFAQAYARARPDLLVVLGDRFEVHAAALAALPFNLPVAHIHGGESTAGAIDDPIRHSLTKLSHLHFPATERYARRIAAMGEEPWRITVAGAPGLDTLREVEPLDRAALAARLGVDPQRPFVLITYHPVTLEPERAPERVDALLAALRDVDAQLVITHPNADTGRTAVLERLEAFAAQRTGAHLVVNAGIEAYAGLMAHAEAMVGNSSSGIIEAASFALPVVNVGMRQHGRVRAANVIDALDDTAAIRAALDRALDPAFRASLRGLVNPYGDGHAAQRIGARLREVELGERLLMKHFHEVAA